MNREQAAALLQRSDDVLILTHRRPDGDTIGSGVGLCAALRQMGKAAWLLENPDATSLFTPYLEGYVAPAEFVPQFVVSVDIAGLDLFPQNASIYRDKVDLSIDHHPSNEGFGKENLVEADKAACGEVVYALVCMMTEMNAEIALPLYLAVSTDTGCFVYGNTTPNSHRVAAELIDCDIPYRELNKRHFRTKSFKRLKLESLIMQNMELLQNNSLAIAPISLAMMASIQATEEDAEDIAAFVGLVHGVLHSVTIRELRHGECKISLRTNPNYLNASKTCAILGGGGHVAAAGCTIHGTMEEAKAAIISAIERVQCHG